MTTTDWRLDNADGSWFLVFAPPLIPNHAKISAYYREFRSQFDIVEFASPESDRELYPFHTDYYQHLANLLDPQFDPEVLTPVSRHQFFVATDPVEYGELGLIPGISGLEQLLGVSYPDPAKANIPKVSAPNTPVITTGDTEADIVTALCLTFKKNALPLGKIYPLQTLSKMIKQASDLLRGDEANQELQSEQDKQLFEHNQSDIDKKFKKIGGGFLS